MRITVLPQRRHVELDGSRRVSDILQRLGLLPGTVMVIRGDSLLCDSDLVEPDESIEIRNVISGG
ncbi:MAG: thiamine biosynthesis protein ThiS [Candidatus Binatia bacterium]